MIQLSYDPNTASYKLSPLNVCTKHNYTSVSVAVHTKNPVNTLCCLAVVTMYIKAARSEIM